MMGGGRVENLLLGRGVDCCSSLFLGSSIVCLACNSVLGPVLLGQWYKPQGPAHHRSRVLIRLVLWPSLGYDFGAAFPSLVP